MKRVVQFLLVLSIAIAVLALYGLGRVWIPYSIGEAFNKSGLLRTPENLEAEQQIRLWAIYLFVAICVLIVLLAAYCKNYRRERKTADYSQTSA